MSEPVYFLKLELENVRCFGEKAELDLSDGHGNWRQWTVILGDNGTGKTTLLQCLAGMEVGIMNLKSEQPEKLYVPSIVPAGTERLPVELIESPAIPPLFTTLIVTNDGFEIMALFIESFSNTFPATPPFAPSIGWLVKLSQVALSIKLLL